MAAANSLTHERLIELLTYDALTGIFRWRATRKGRGCVAGKEVGSDDGQGYLRVAIDGRRYKLHRLAFFYMRCCWPDPECDHEDGDHSNNIWKNLREASRALNQQNQRRAQRNNKATGLLGVKKNGNGWASRINVDGKRIALGTFQTPIEAHMAYINAKRELHALCSI